jgi:hypothetical protein
MATNDMIRLKIHSVSVVRCTASFTVKLHKYSLHPQIFDFFITLIFLIRRMIKVNIKIKCNKYLGMEVVSQFFLIR